MKIGILLTGHTPDELAPELGGYDAMFARLLAGRGFTFDSYAVVDGQFPVSPVAADGWLITGSKHGAYEDLPWIPRLEQLIRDIQTSGRPLIGVCFGHQIIAQALGGKVEKFKGGWAVGHQTYDINGQSMVMNAWHQDQVTELPPGARVIGSNDFCENAALVVGDNILTIQPHPEHTSAMVEGLIRYRGRGNIPDATLDRALAGLGTPSDSARFADMMADFFSGKKP